MTKVQAQPLVNAINILIGLTFAINKFVYPKQQQQRQPELDISGYSLDARNQGPGPGLVFPC